MQLAILFCCLFPIVLVAQSPTPPSFTKTEERTYKLVQLPNGDLLPLVRQGIGNTDTYFENGKPVLANLLNSSGVLMEKKVYRYMGDSISTVKTYDKSGQLIEMDSVLYKDKKRVQSFNFLYRLQRRDTVVEIETYIELDSMHTRLHIQKSKEPDKQLLMTQLSDSAWYNTELDGQGRPLKTDTIRFHQYADGKKTKTDFISGTKHLYTLCEYGRDSLNNWTSKMIFYNKDTIGDHIECVLRKIIYKASDSAMIPLSRESMYGYWVMVDGMRYWHFKADGTVDLYRRPYADTFYTKRWGFDAYRKEPYIILTEKDLQECDKEDAKQIVGNWLYFDYDVRKKTLTMGDITCSKMPVLERVK